MPDEIRGVPVEGNGFHNRLIDGLPAAERSRLMAHMELSSLPRGERIFGQGEAIQSVYFPVNAVLSLVTSLSDGTTIEISTIGNEGTTGAPFFLGNNSIANASCLCQIGGDSLRIEAQAFQEVLDESEQLHAVMGRYVGALLVQVGQAVACNGLHPTIERAARWLLTSHDRVGKDEFMLTQEFLSYMLGARRASVNIAARTLQTAGLIRYNRGRLTILDRAGLEDVACECYFVMRAALEDALGSPQHDT